MSASGNPHGCNVRLWGMRPVHWGLRMVGADPELTIASLPPTSYCEVARFLGLVLPATGESDEPAKALAMAIRQGRAERPVDPEGPSTLCDNLALLRDSLDLDQVEVDLVMFRAMLRLHPGFEALAGSYVGQCSDFVFHQRLAALFGVSANDVAAALRQQGKLTTSGLATVTSGVLGPLPSRFQLIKGLIGSLMRPVESAGELLGPLLPRRRHAGLALSDFPHLASEIRLLLGRLEVALSRHLVGVNVLLHGTPGTGKTELSAALAQAVGAPLFECLGVDEDCNDSLTPRARLAALRQAQRIARIASGGLILIDEAEDLFPTSWSDSRQTPTKAAINECLDLNPTPTIWISNRTRHMDEAFLRRFDLVIHVPPLPASAKRRLLAARLPVGILNDAELRRYADHRQLSPAMLTRMAAVATDGGGDAAEARENLRVVSRNYLQTLGGSPLSDSSASPMLTFDPALLNTDPPLESVFDTIGQASSGLRMLLHGPPGAGKTEMGSALAARLDKPLLRRLASSLLSCWLGETEKNLRDMFVEAHHEGGVLLLDEADSFLGNRERAVSRYGIVQTNELLAQMEAFDGVFVCATNRLTDLDPAALRRFDLKVEFRPLRVEQRHLLLRQCCDLLGIGPCIDGGDTSRAAIARINTMDGLTPGDAAAALRRLRFSGQSPNIESLLSALQDECRYKPATSRSIGFVR